MFLKLIGYGLLGLIGVQVAAANQQQLNSAGEFEFKHDNSGYRSALLMNTQLSGEVNGLVASLSMTQQFKNTSEHWVDGRYVFPLPPGASIDSLTITIGDRVIEGVVKEKKQARKSFQHAKQQGKKAALLQQHRANLFSLAVANIAPLSLIQTHISYVERVHYAGGEFSLRLPTTLTPRYIPGVPLAKQLKIATENELAIDGFGWAQDSTAVPDASAITPPQVYKQALEAQDLAFGEAAASHYFSLDLTIDAGMPLDSLQSSSHEITYGSNGQVQYEVGLLKGRASMDRDLVLRWKPVIGGAPQAALFSQTLDGDQYSMLMLVPPQMDIANALPRDVTFIIDSSGSMAGTSMPQAKASLLQALSHLSHADRFNIIDFDSAFTPLFENSMPVSNRSLRQARNMINALIADGGTEMTGALAYALSRSRSENTLNQIIFITDGSIGNEDQLFELIHSQLGDARLFTVGIGSAPNAFFMRKAAKFGRGSYTYVGTNESADDVMDELFYKITRPILRDVTVELPPDAEYYPAQIPDLYASEPVIVISKSKQAMGKVKISGSLLGQKWQRSLEQNQFRQNTADNLDTLWARQKIEFLMEQLLTGEIQDQQARPLITALGTTHQLVTRFTSFVAIEQAISRPQAKKSKHQNMPNLMPQGNTMQAPQTATPATLMAVIGLMLIIVGVLLRNTKTSRVAF